MQATVNPPDHANVLFRPPLLYLTSMLVGGALQWLAPIRLLPWPIAIPAGIVTIGAAIAIFVAAFGRFSRARTTVPTDEPTTAVVRDGPYRFSRNPIYVALSLLHLGVAAWVNSPWLVVTLAVTLVLMHFGVVRREERYLDRKFGAEYRDYRATVRRWI